MFCLDILFIFYASLVHWHLAWRICIWFVCNDTWLNQTSWVRKTGLSVPLLGKANKSTYHVKKKWLQLRRTTWATCMFLKLLSALFILSQEVLSLSERWLKTLHSIVIVHWSYCAPTYEGVCQLGANGVQREVILFSVANKSYHTAEWCSAILLAPYHKSTSGHIPACRFDELLEMLPRFMLLHPLWSCYLTVK